MNGRERLDWKGKSVKNKIVNGVQGLPGVAEPNTKNCREKSREAQEQSRFGIGIATLARLGGHSVAILNESVFFCIGLWLKSPVADWKGGQNGSKSVKPMLLANLPPKSMQIAQNEQLITYDRSIPVKPSQSESNRFDVIFSGQWVIVHDSN
jgi:hypothetical protein